MTGYLTPVPASPTESRTGPPTFSVCISAYQVAPLIADALTSLREQTVAPHEVIVCDDGSMDDLEAALAPFLEEITLIRQENRGMAAARNTAVAHATGEFAVFLDADDRFEPTRLERLGDLAMARPDLDIITTDAFIEIDGAIVRRYYTATNRFVVDDQRIGILTANFFFGLLAVRLTALLDVGVFDEAVPVVEDWDCWLRLIMAGSRAGLVDEPLALYRVRSGSGSSNRVRLMQGRIDVLERALAQQELSGEERRVANAALAVARRLLTVAQAQRALVDGSADARARSLHIVRGGGFTLASRAKASLGVIAPRLAGRSLRRRRERRAHDPIVLLAERE